MNPIPLSPPASPPRRRECPTYLLRLAILGCHVAQRTRRAAQEQDRETGVPDGMVRALRHPGPVVFLLCQQVVRPLDVPLVRAEGLRAVEDPRPLERIEIV